MSQIGEYSKKFNGRVYRRKGQERLYTFAEAVPNDEGWYGVLLYDVDRGGYEPFWESLDDFEDQYEEVKLKATLKCEAFGCKKKVRYLRKDDHGQMVCPEHWHAACCTPCDNCSQHVVLEWTYRSKEQDGWRLCKNCHLEEEARALMENA